MPHQVTGFGQTRDLFGYLILFLPDAFPAHETNRSIDDWFPILMGGVDTTILKIRNPGALEELIKVKRLCQESYDLFKVGEEDAGRFRLQDAARIFDEVSALLRQKRRLKGKGED